MTCSFDKAGNLIIRTQGQERRELRQESKKEGFHSNDFLYELFESFIANSEFQWVEPEEVAALTAAPILGTRDVNDNVVDVWWFPDYAIRSPQEDLLNHGRVVFQKGEEA